MREDSSIACVPNEILADVFDLVCHPTSKEHLKLSQVCRAFRTMIVGMPHYWTYISNKQSEEWYNLQLERSGERGLIVHYVEPKYHAGINPEEAVALRLRFVRTIAAHCHRWTEFTYSVNYATAITQELSGLTLPRLRTLSVVSFRVHDQTAIQLLKTWQTPALQFVSCSAPLLDTIVETSPSLVSIQAGHITGTGSSSLRRALQHPNAQGLQRLSMTMYIDSLDALHVGGNSFPDTTLELSSLKSLHIDIQLDTAILVDVFLSHVSLPRLESLSLHLTGVVSYGNGYAIMRAFEEWLGCAKLDKLRVLDLSVRSRTGMSAGSKALFDGIRRTLETSWEVHSCEERSSLEELPPICVPDVKYFVSPKASDGCNTDQAH
jgi:hypothetical protein